MFGREGQAQGKRTVIALEKRNSVAEFDEWQHKDTGHYKFGNHALQERLDYLKANMPKATSDSPSREAASEFWKWKEDAAQVEKLIRNNNASLPRIMTKNHDRDVPTTCWKETEELPVGSRLSHHGPVW